MDNSQANKDDLAKRLEKLAREHAQQKQAEIDQRSSGDLANRFVSDHTREEYDNLKRLLLERAEEMNSKKNGGLPPFVLSGSSIQLGHVALYFSFDQPIVNRPDNRLDCASV